MSASGGADTPEDMAGAIKEAKKLAWKKPTKIAFIIADAPCHGEEFHKFEDSYPDGTPGIDIIEELKRLQQEAGSQGTMTITFGRITAHTDDMIKRFQEHGVTIDEVAIEEASKLTKTVTASVRKSIFKTVTCVGGKPSVSFASIGVLDEVLEGDGAPSSLGRKSDASLKNYTISASVPSSIDWTEHLSSKVKVYRNARIKKVSDLQEPIKMGLLKFVSSVAGKSMSPTDKTYESTMLMRRAPSPFAEGEIRLAYHGQLAKNEKDLGKEGAEMVFKSFKHLGKRVHDRDQYLKQMEVSSSLLNGFELFCFRLSLSNYSSMSSGVCNC